MQFKNIAYLFCTARKPIHVLSRQLGGSVMLGLGIWVTTQDTEYKHLGGNLVSAAQDTQ